MNESTSEIIRKDENVRKAGEMVVGQFKYLAGLCWAPIIVILAFFRGEASEFGWVGKLLVTGPICALMVAGSLFFLAYQKQTLMFAHSLMGRDAIEKAAEANPKVHLEVSQNIYVAQRLGHIANNVAFPLLTISYAMLGIAAILAVWL